jgi:hypothetical protein
MTTPAGTVSMSDVRNETGDTGSISFSDWFVRHVAKQATGPISMSNMRGKTCHPANSTVLGGYVSTEIFWYDANLPAVNSAYWMEFVSHGTASVQHYGDWNNGFPQIYTSQGGQAFFDLVFNGRAIRAFRGQYRMDDPATSVVKLYAIRWVEG